MSATPIQPPTLASWPLALTVLLWIAWLGVILVADFLGFMMFAFADSPSSGNAAKLMIGPVLVWFGITFVAGVLLLIFKGWWQIPLAFVLAISPPFVVFAGYNLLSGTGTASPTGPPAAAVTPAPRTYNVPPGGSRPTPTTQPDFNADIQKWSSRSTSGPSQ